MPISLASPPAAVAPAIDSFDPRRSFGGMTAIAQRLDRRLKTKAWRPQTAREVKARIAEIITLADRDALDLAKSRRVEQDVLDLLDAPQTR